MALQGGTLITRPRVGQEEAAWEAREKAFAELRQAGAAAKQRVAETLEKLVTVDIVPLAPAAAEFRHFSYFFSHLDDGTIARVFPQEEVKMFAPASGAALK